MKYIHYLLCLILLMLVSGCKTKKVAIQPTIENIYTDTTKVVQIDSQYVSEVKDSVAAKDSLNISYVINFIDSGGQMLISPDGTTSYSGLRSIMAIDKSRHDYSNQLTKANKGNSTYTDKASGIHSDSIKILSQPQNKATRTYKWRSRIVIPLVSLVAVGVLIWAVFLYLKRKK